jgi:hypothetical protein
LLLAEGLRPKEVALRNGTAHTTVRSQLAEARRRVGVGSTARLIAECYEQGWVKTPEHVAEIEEWPEITPAQRAYLDVFDRMLRTRYGSEQERRARLEMRYMLGAMCIEKGIGMPGARREPERPVLALAV